MGKLFSLENNKSEEDVTKSNTLIIDKLIESSKKDISPISVTANILDQKKELEKNIEKSLGKSTSDQNKKEDDAQIPSEIENTTNDEEEDSSSEKEQNDLDSSSDSEEESDNDSEKEKDSEKKNNSEEENKSNSEEGNNSEEKAKENESSSKKEDNGASKEKESSNKDNEEEESDISKLADDKDTLKSILGSGHSESSTVKQENKKEVSKENLSLSKKRKIHLDNIFYPILESYVKYTISLEEFGIDKGLSLEEQPVVYIKENVLKSLNGFISVLDSYRNKNNSIIETNTNLAKNLNEKLTILTSFIKEEKFHFTNFVISDTNLISNVGIINSSNPIETSKNLIKYIDDSNNIISGILKNEFSNMLGVFTSNEFKKEDNDLVYSKMLPGFNAIRMHIEPYSNFSKIKISDYNYYSIKIMKMEDLYNLDGIAINDFNEINSFMDKLNLLLIKFTSSIDTLNIVNENMNKLLEEVKALIYDIEKDKYKELGQLGIDNKVKDFIKFKILFEIVNVNIRLISEFILHSLTIINKVIELKE